MKRGIVLAFALAHVGCGNADIDTDAPPVLTADTESLCTESSPSCINAGVEVTDVGGVRVIHKYVEGDPIVSVRVAFGATDFDYTPAGAHARHVARTLLDWRGPAGVASADWKRAWSDIGGAFWTFSSADYTGVGAHAPRPHWEAMWDYLADALNDPPVESPEWAISQFQAGYESEFDDPAAAASIDAWNHLFTGHAYNMLRDHRDALGSVTSADITEVWAEWQTRHNVTVIVVGDVPADTLQEKIFATFSHITEDVNPGEPELLAASPATASVRTYSGSATWYVSSTFVAPSISDPDWAPLFLATRVLSDRLFEEVREKRGLVYTIYSYLTSMRVGYGRLTFSTDRPAETLPVVREVIDDLRTTPPTQAEVDAQLARYRTSFLASSATNDGLTSILASYELVAGDRLLADSQFERLEAVTPEDVSDALDTYFHGLQLAAAGDGEVLTPDALLTLSP